MTESPQEFLQQYDSERAKLDNKIIKPEKTTNISQEIEIILAEKSHSGVEEHRPTYPDFGSHDLTTGNLSSKDPEEMAIRTSLEVALTAQSEARDIYQDKKVLEKKFVSLSEEIKKIFVYSGKVSGEILLCVGLNKKNQPIFEKINAVETPFFSIIEGEKLPIFQEINTEKIIRKFMDLSPTVLWHHGLIYTRLGLTKSREMAGPELLHKWHTRQTTNQPPQNSRVPIEEL